MNLRRFIPAIFGKRYRCKPGDLAVVTKLDSSQHPIFASPISYLRYGMTVQVVSIDAHGMWTLKEPLDASAECLGITVRADVLAIADELLTPLRGDLNGDQTETDAGLPAPIKTLEPA